MPPRAPASRASATTSPVLAKLCGRVEEAGREAERALAHRRRDQLRIRASSASPSARGSTSPITAPADRAEPDIGRVIDPDGPGRGAAQHPGDVGVAAAVIADEGGGHALHQESGDQARGRIVRGQVFAHMGVRIDEAGRDDHSARVDHPRRRSGEATADRPDPVAGNRDVADERRVGAGIDGAAADHQVHALGGGGGAHGEERKHNPATAFPANAGEDLRGFAFIYSPRSPAAGGWMHTAFVLDPARPILPKPERTVKVDEVRERGDVEAPARSTARS